MLDRDIMDNDELDLDGELDTILGDGNGHSSDPNPFEELGFDGQGGAIDISVSGGNDRNAMSLAFSTIIGNEFKGEWPGIMMFLAKFRPEDKRARRAIDICIQLGQQYLDSDLYKVQLLVDQARQDEKAALSAMRRGIGEGDVDNVLELVAKWRKAKLVQVAIRRQRILYGLDVVNRPYYWDRWVTSDYRMKAATDEVLRYPHAGSQYFDSARNLLLRELAQYDETGVRIPLPDAPVILGKGKAMLAEVEASLPWPLQRALLIAIEYAVLDSSPLAKHHERLWAGTDGSGPAQGGMFNRFMPRRRRRGGEGGGDGGDGMDNGE